MYEREERRESLKRMSNDQGAAECSQLVKRKERKQRDMDTRSTNDGTFGSSPWTGMAISAEASAAIVCEQLAPSKIR